MWDNDGMKAPKRPSEAEGDRQGTQEKRAGPYVFVGMSMNVAKR